MASKALIPDVEAASSTHRGPGSLRAPLAKDSMPRENIEIAAETWLACGAIDITSDWDVTGQYDLGTTAFEA